ncbi:MAG: ATP-binding protein [Nitrososphaera sp.]
MVEKPVSLTIKSKIIILSMFLSLTTLFAVSMLSYITSDSLLRQRVSDQLTSESTGRGAAVSSLMDSRTLQIRVLATNDAIQQVVSHFAADQPSTISASALEDYKRQFRSEIDSFRDVAGNSIGLQDVAVYGRDGKLLASTDSFISNSTASNATAVSARDQNSSTIVLNSAGFPQDIRAILPTAVPGASPTPASFHFGLVNGARDAIVIVPIISRSVAGATNSTSAPPNTQIGEMVATMNMNGFDDILLNRKGLGQTGEVYLVNNNKIMITESRFIKNAPFRELVDTEAVRACLVQGTEVHDIYPDYRTIPVVGFSYCARDRGFVLLAEFDEAEIFSPVSTLRNYILATAGAITVVVVVTSLYVSKTISRPIIQLRDAADRISKGDYEYEVHSESRDEVGQLASQFDSMRKSILETNNNLNKMVRERTKELGDMTNALDATAIVAVTDKDGKITKVNHKFVEISKYREDELIGMNHRILKSGYHSEEFFKEMWKTISSGRIFEGEIKNMAKDGSYYWVKTTIVPFLDEYGKPKQYIAIHSDVTDLKNYEEKLQRALERERENAQIIKRQAEELRQTNIELRNKDKLKDEFLSMASHELKTPLTPIIGWCGVLKSEKILGPISKDQKNALETIEKNAVKLEKMISDMLDVQKIELGEIRFNIGEADVDRILKNIEKDFQLAMKDKAVQFTVHSQPGLKLHSDEAKITQVLSALLYNSIDFVPPTTGRIDVSAEERNGDIVFCVRDNGPGIAKEKQQYLFQKFYQVDTSLTRKHGGTGLGLAISKGLVSGLGGTIWVETEEGKGSSFYFSIPKDRQKDNNESTHN